MILLDSKLCWWPEHRLLIGWHHRSIDHNSQFVSSRMHNNEIDLVLHVDIKHESYLLVLLNRSKTLSEHEPMLSKIFDEYEIVSSSERYWRGHVQLSPCEVIRWNLMISHSD